MDPVRKEKLRIARSSNTPEARIQAFYYLAGDVELFDVFVDGLSDRHYGIVEASIYALAAFKDGEWKILLDYLEDESFGSKSKIYKCLRWDEVVLDDHMERLLVLIPSLSYANEIIGKIYRGPSDRRVADSLTLKSREYHDFWREGNSEFVKFLSMNNHESLNFVYRSIFRESVSIFRNITENVITRLTNDKNLSRNLQILTMEIFDYMSTLVNLSNKYREHHQEFDLISQLDNLNQNKNVENIQHFLSLYLEGELNAELVFQHFTTKALDSNTELTDQYFKFETLVGYKIIG